MSTETGARIIKAMAAARISQRDLAAATGISQPTLSRVITGERVAKMPEIVAIAAATGCTVTQLIGDPRGERVLCAARSTNGASMQKMREELLGMLSLEEHLDEYGIPEVGR